MPQGVAVRSRGWDPNGAAGAHSVLVCVLSPRPFFPEWLDDQPCDSHVTSVNGEPRTNAASPHRWFVRAQARRGKPACDRYTRQEVADDRCRRGASVRSASKHIPGHTAATAGAGTEGLPWLAGRFADGGRTEHLLTVRPPSAREIRAPTGREGHQVIAGSPQGRLCDGTPPGDRCAPRRGTATAPTQPIASSTCSPPPAEPPESTAFEPEPDGAYPPGPPAPTSTARTSRARSVSALATPAASTATGRASVAHGRSHARFPFAHHSVGDNRHRSPAA